MKKFNRLAFLIPGLYAIFHKKWIGIGIMVVNIALLVSINHWFGGEFMSYFDYSFIPSKFLPSFIVGIVSDFVSINGLLLLSSLIFRIGGGYTSFDINTKNKSPKTNRMLMLVGIIIVILPLISGLLNIHLFYYGIEGQPGIKDKLMFFDYLIEQPIIKDVVRLENVSDLPGSNKIITEMNISYLNTAIGFTDNKWDVTSKEDYNNYLKNLYIFEYTDKAGTQKIMIIDADIRKKTIYSIIIDNLDDTFTTLSGDVDQSPLVDIYNEFKNGFYQQLK